MQIASIVEGHGEVTALPVLLRRLDEWLSPTQSKCQKLAGQTHGQR
ncbi:MAG: hypothetical protein GY862_22395 [Gammaproteobacteria bacterium]|nr:hypothetical protein [Gammaproteobacteria bacterium]